MSRTVTLVAVAIGVAAAAVAWWWSGREVRIDHENAALVARGKPVYDKPAGKFYLVRLSDGGFLALSRKCTHLGCSVPWNEAAGRFACPCHASVFDLRGDVLAPPAPRPLDLFAVRIENDIVKVDTRSPRRRDRFEPSQAVTS